MKCRRPKSSHLAIPLRIRGALRAITGLLVMGSIAGCSFGPGAKLEHRVVAEDEFLATDARLRVVTNTSIGAFSRPGLVDPTRIVCTEPSPDVAAAVSTSFASSLSVLEYGSGAITHQTVEALAQLVERTAAIQTLRDKMYQTCLAYQNGAITGTDYSLAMANLDKTIVALVFAESASGRYGASGASLGGEAEGSAQATLIGLPDMLNDVEGQAATLEAAEAKVKEAEAARDAYIVANPEATDEDAKLAELKQAVADARSERAEAYKGLKRAAATSAAAAAKFSKVAGFGSIESSANPLVAAELGRMLDIFVNDDWAESYISACLVEMARPDVPNAPPGERVDDWYRSWSLATDQLERREADLQLVDAEIAKLSAQAPTPTDDEQEPVGTQQSDEAPESPRLQILMARREALESRRDAAYEEARSIRRVLESFEVSPPEMVFDAYQRRYESASRHEDRTERDQGDDAENARVNMVSAMNATRKSGLAAYCDAQLGSFVNAAYEKQFEIRKRRVEIEGEAETSSARARLLEAANAWVKTRKAELAACDAASPGDTDEAKKKRAECRAGIDDVQKFIGSGHGQ